MNTLDEIERDAPHSAPLIAELRQLSRQFQFEVMSQRLSQVPHDDT